MREGGWDSKPGGAAGLAGACHDPSGPSLSPAPCECPPTAVTGRAWVAGDRAAEGERLERCRRQRRGAIMSGPGLVAHGRDREVPHGDGGLPPMLARVDVEDGIPVGITGSLATG